MSPSSPWKDAADAILCRSDSSFFSILYMLWKYGKHAHRDPSKILHPFPELIQLRCYQIASSALRDASFTACNIISLSLFPTSSV